MFDMRWNTIRSRAIGTTLALALASTLGACGSEDEDNSDARTATGGTSQPASAEGQIRKLLRDVQAHYIAGRGSAYCSSLTAGGRKLTAEYSKQYALGATCEEFIVRTSATTRQAGVKQKPTKTLAVRVTGDRALATVSDGGRRPSSLVFVRQNGAWKLTDPGFRALEREAEKSGVPGGGPAQ